ncbi:endonuclease/exonuclease/phosphatase family protein [Streptomyces sp. FIT100]|uniref:endonuclease/exonuclease/phosphatase family protein n=1 Tax=Streptomyces sp. FIT100 TaxID=2837956 RepID=UPI0021C967B9|nr:endonuclease/exonuclease/phosphatase family protein [Streptomyces sp. FIT100]
MSPLRTAAAAGSDSTLPHTLSLVSPTSPREGDRLTFRWSTDAPHPKNWIGIYDGDRRPGVGSSLVWEYVTTASGEITLDTTGLGEGTYTAYLLATDGYDILTRTEPFTIALRPPVTPPHCVVDSFTTGEYAAGSRVSVVLGPLWIRPQGNASGAPSFRRLAGDSWLGVSSDGTISGTAPALPTARPARITIGVKDSAGGTDTVTVQVPVRTPAARTRLTVASLNLWEAGRNTADSHEKLLRLVLGQRLDAVALQETGGTAAEPLARALGWHFYDSPAGVGLISRFPLAGTTAPLTDLPAVAATLRLPGDRTVRLWAAQLDEAAYGPYALRDGRTAAEVEAAEVNSVRYRQAGALLAAMKSDLAASRTTPVVLAAGLASPSHLDRPARRGRTAVVRWPVTVALGRAGLTDAFRDENPNAARQPGTTWSPVRPDEPRDRIDQVQYAGPLRVEGAYTLCTGWPRPVPDAAGNGWPSDHAAPAVTFSLR